MAKALLLGWQEEEVDRLTVQLSLGHEACDGSSARSTRPSTPARLHVVVRDRVGEALSVLHHWVNLWPGQKARTSRLIPDALGQPLDDPEGLPKRHACLRRLASCLIQVSQRRLDLPLFCRQAEVGRYLGGLAQVADGLLAVPIPRR